MTSDIARVSVTLVNEQTLHRVPHRSVTRMRLLVELLVADGHSLARETVARVCLLVKVQTVIVCALRVVDEAVAVLRRPKTRPSVGARQCTLLQTVTLVVVSVDGHDAGERLLLLLVGEVSTMASITDNYSPTELTRFVDAELALLTTFNSVP